MPKNDANTAIRCRVESCQFHCDDVNYCSLNAIQVESCQNGCTGKACDESMCASYRCK